MKDALKKQVEERARLQRAKERLELGKDKLREQMEKGKQDVEKKLVEANKDKEKFKKLLMEEKEKAVPLPYLPMATKQLSNSSPSYLIRRISSTPTFLSRFSSFLVSRSQTDEMGSLRISISHPSVAASTIHIDMLQSPNGERGSSLTVIQEDVSAGIASGSAPPPTYFTNPPIDYGKYDGAMVVISIGREL
jgi:hypothetical protein